ncbi:hypothetical protein [Photorhabdus temperata]|uniref:hypothetical protein n=1 Tax=Photorhabdus temperata TaxID=574560 RepID=UPI00038A521F|nr:hypothetical protein [Photorhabdus temperata]EQB99531.1 hypothetical protein B738_16743 [Photorhabdus temperata subsp. temperata M1021]
MVKDIAINYSIANQEAGIRKCKILLSHIDMYNIVSAIPSYDTCIIAVDNGMPRGLWFSDENHSLFMNNANGIFFTNYNISVGSLT